jgi:hydrogenase maturation protease
MVASSGALVVGIGNRLRGDDGVGLYVASLIRDASLADVSVVEGVGDAYSLIEMWSRITRVFVIDCTVSSKEVGEISRFDALSETIPADLFAEWSTHSISVIKAINMAGALGRLPWSIVIYGIEGGDFSRQSGLSPAVEAAAHSVAQCIAAEIRCQSVRDTLDESA